jgi:hypothetical protein
LRLLCIWRLWLLLLLLLLRGRLLGLRLGLRLRLVACAPGFRFCTPALPCTTCISSSMRH